jgi:sulfate adenylyltransferase
MTDIQDIVLNNRQLCDLEMILNGGFYPLNGFMNEQDYHSVLENLHLTTGDLWPIPITLSVNKETGTQLKTGNTVILRNTEYLPLAEMTIESVYQPNIEKECKAVFGCVDQNHPYMKLMLENPDKLYIGGKVTAVQKIPHFDFVRHRLTPNETRDYFKTHNWNVIVAFQTRNPMHRSHVELTKYALKDTGSTEAKLLLQPVAGETQDCDVPYPIRVRCYEKLEKVYPENSFLLCLLPLSMRMAGPREALWHALIRQNYGATHFVVGRDHAGPSFNKQNGEPFFDPYAAHQLLDKYKNELKIKIIQSQMIVYVENRQEYLPMDQVTPSDTIKSISGTEQRRLLTEGKEIPDWFSYPEIVEELRCAYLPKNKRGFCLYFVGLSGSGKTTLAKALKAKLDEMLRLRTITILDGDVVRLNLSKGLGFNKEDRSINVRRIGYVASEIVKHGGICLCASIAPYQDDRTYNKMQIGSGYIEILVDTDLNTCESRDVKGLYKLARAGTIKEFTGVSDPFEPAPNADITLKCDHTTDLNENINIIIDKLKELEFL